MEDSPLSAVKKPLFSFGLIADVQYADKENGEYEGRIQRYREAPGKLETAVTAFNALKQDLPFVLTLGDIIDGNTTSEKSLEDFNVVLDALAKLEVPAYHLLGNHCLALPRDVMLSKLAMKSRYYRADIAPNWALVVLDSMDVSVRWPEDSGNYQEAVKYLQAHPLSDAYPQSADWNGGIGAEQKAWLAEIIAGAERDGTKLIVAAHHPVGAGSCPPTHLLWNHEEVASMLVNSPAVKLFLCGHYHVGGYACLSSTHFVTFEAILEAPPDTTAYGVVDVHESEVIINGFGSASSRRLPLKAP